VVVSFTPLTSFAANEAAPARGDRVLKLGYWTSKGINRRFNLDIAVNRDQTWELNVLEIPDRLQVAVNLGQFVQKSVSGDDKIRPDGNEVRK